MTKFNKGDIVRVISHPSNSYTALVGMVFEVLHGGGNVAIDATGLYEATKGEYGWPDNNGGYGWYISNEGLELVIPAKPEKAVKRTVPVDKKALSPQCKKLLDLLQAKGSVTAMEAAGVYRIRSLSRRITDLKQAGYKIVRDLSKDTTGQRYARYYIKGNVAEAIAA